MFRRREKKKTRLFRNIVYKGGGKRNSFFVRREIGLVKEFISLRIIKNEVKFIVKSIISFNGRSVGGRCSSSVMKIDSRIYARRSAFQLTVYVLFASSNKVCCVKSITRLLFKSRSFLRIGKSIVVSNKRRRRFESVENIFFRAIK